MLCQIEMLLRITVTKESWAKQLADCIVSVTWIVRWSAGEQIGFLYFCREKLTTRDRREGVKRPSE